MKRYQQDDPEERKLDPRLKMFKGVEKVLKIQKERKEKEEEEKKKNGN